MFTFYIQKTPDSSGVFLHKTPSPTILSVEKYIYPIYESMRLWWKMLLSCMAWALCSTLFLVPAQSVEAQVEGDYGDRWSYKIDDGSNNTKYAEDLLDRIVGEEKDDTWIIQTDLDRVDQAEWVFAPEYKISNTLDSSRTKLGSYLEWAVFIWLSAAVALIVYNWLLLVLSPLAEDQMAQVKKRLMYIIAGTLWMTWFYFVMKILLSILAEVISTSWTSLF